MGEVGGTTALAGLRVDGETKIYADITTDGDGSTFPEANGFDLRFDDDVTLAADVTLTARNALFNGSIDGTSVGSESLTVNSPGITWFNGEVSETPALRSLTTDAPGATHLDTDILVTGGDVTFLDTVILGDDAIIQGDNVTFESTVNAMHSGVEGLTVNSAGVTWFKGDIGKLANLEHLTTDAAGETHLGADTVFRIGTRIGALTFNDDVTLIQDTEVVAGGNVTFGGRVDADTDGQQGLSVTTVVADSTTSFNEVGGTAALKSLKSVASGVGSTTSLGGDVNVKQDGTSGFDVRFQSAVQLVDDAAISGDGVLFTKTVRGNYDLAVGSTSATFFQGSVGTLRSLTTTGDGVTYLFGSNVATSGGDVTFQNDVILKNNVAIATDQSVTFGGTVNADTPGGQGIWFDIDRGLTFMDEVGTTSVLAGLRVVDGETTIYADITTDGDGTTFPSAGGFDLRFDDDVALAANVTLTANNVLFNGAVNGTNAGGQSLTVNSPGMTWFKGNVGVDTPLNLLLTDAGGSTQFAGIAAASPSSVNTQGDQIFGDNVLLRADVAFSAADGDVKFEGRVDTDSAHALSQGDLLVNANNTYFHGQLGTRAFSEAQLGIGSGVGPTMTVERGNVFFQDAADTVNLRGTLQINAAGATVSGKGNLGATSARTTLRSVMFDTNTVTVAANDVTLERVVVTRDASNGGSGSGIVAAGIDGLTLQYLSSNSHAGNGFLGTDLAGTIGFSQTNFIGNIADGVNITNRTNAADLQFAVVTATDNARGVYALRVDSLNDAQSIYRDNNDGGIILSQVTNMARFVDMYARDNDADGNGIGDGIRVYDVGTVVADRGVRVFGHASQQAGMVIKNVTGSVTLKQVSAASNSLHGIDIATVGGNVTMEGVNTNGNESDGIHISGVNGEVQLNTVNTANNGGDGVDISNSANAKVVLTRVTATGNDPGVVVDGVASFYDRYGNYRNNANGGVKVRNVGNSVSMHGTTAYDNDAGLDGVGDGINIAGAGSVSLGSIAASATASGQQRSGIVISNVDDRAGTGTARITIDTVTTENNDADGIKISKASAATVTLKAVHANGNGEDGVDASQMLRFRDYNSTTNTNGAYGTRVSTVTSVVDIDSINSIDNVQSGLLLQSVSNPNVADSGDVESSTFAENGQYGVHIISTDNVRLWGNTVNNNLRDGIYVESGTGNTFSQNSIYDNARLGINLLGGSDLADGTTPNDENTTTPADSDADTGPNKLQNFPVISSAVKDLDTQFLVIDYYVPSGTTHSTYDLKIEFFIADGSGREGKRYLGSDIYTAANASTIKQAAFNVSGLPIDDGTKILATATDAAGNTSEFSLSAAVSSTASDWGSVPISSGAGLQPMIANNEAVDSVFSDIDVL